MRPQSRSTDELMHMLSEETKLTISEVLADVEPHCVVPPLKELLNAFMKEKNCSPTWLFEQVGVERTAGYRILSGSRQPGRNVLLRLAIRMELTVAQTQRLLRSGGRAELYPRLRRDALIIYALSHQLALAQVEEELQRSGERSLYEKV